jgi:hypothetical protein
VNATEGFRARLVERKLVSPEDLSRAAAAAGERDISVEAALVALGIITEDQAGAVMAEELDVPYVFPQADAIDPELVRRFPAETLRRLRAIPIVRDDRGVNIAAARPLPPDVLRALEMHAGAPVSMSLASPRRIAALLDELAPGDERVRDAGTLATLYGHVARAIHARATEVRFEPDGEAVVVRYRIGGRLEERERLPVALLMELAARAAALGERPAVFGATAVTVAVLKTCAGESIRIGLSPREGPMRVPVEALRALRRLVGRRRGFVLIASGASRLGHVVLTALDGGDRSIVAVERRARETDGSILRVETGGTVDDAIAPAVAYRPDVLFVGDPPERPWAARAVVAAAEESLVLAASPEAEAAGAIAGWMERGVPGTAMARVLECVIARRGPDVTVVECGPALRRAVARGADASALERAMRGGRR